MRCAQMFQKMSLHNVEVIKVDKVDEVDEVECFSKLSWDWALVVIDRVDGVIISIQLNLA